MDNNIVLELKKITQKVIALSLKTEKVIEVLRKPQKIKVFEKITETKKEDNKASINKTVSQEIFHMTGTDIVINIIKKAKKGVNISLLKEKTGFGDKKIWNIVFRAAQKGRLKRISRGVYSLPK